MEKSTNPKDLAAVARVPLDLLPPGAMVELARVLQYGATKYGRYNWRAAGVRPEVYLGAALRHLFRWAAGEDVDRDSGHHHLAHVMACCAIVLDAQHAGMLLPWAPESRAESVASHVAAALGS
jgi:hypothetical protein